MKRLKKIIILLLLLSILSAILTSVFDDTNIENTFRFIWTSALFICGILLGIYHIYYKKNFLVGYFYLSTAIIFLIGIINIYYKNLHLY